MKTSQKIIITLIGLLLATHNIAQSHSDQEPNLIEGRWQFGLNIGAQMSGIKNEDFVSSNFSPLIDVSAGKWFSSELALRVGYKGWYFNTISDNFKHRYGFYFGEAVFNMNRIFCKKHYNSKWGVFLHAGSGYFYNKFYDQPNICANLGISGNVFLNRNIMASINASAIIGWDIYQGDEDILPGISIGASYLF